MFDFDYINFIVFNRNKKNENMIKNVNVNND